MPEAGDVTDEDLISAKSVTVRTAKRRPSDEPAVCCLHQIAYAYHVLSLRGPGAQASV